MCNIYKYCRLFPLSSFYLLGSNCKVWFGGDISSSCPLKLTLFYINLETSMLAIFISFLWTQFPLDCNLSLGNPFLPLGQTAVFNFIFLLLFCFFHQGGQVPLGEKLVRYVLFFYIVACMTTKYKLLLGCELLWYPFKYHCISKYYNYTTSNPQSPVRSLL